MMYCRGLVNFLPAFHDLAPGGNDDAFLFQVFLNCGSIIASISPLRRVPDPDICWKISEGAVQCIKIMVRPGLSEVIVSEYLRV